MKRARIRMKIAFILLILRHGCVTTELFLFYLKSIDFFKLLCSYVIFLYKIQVFRYKCINFRPKLISWFFKSLKQVYISEIPFCEWWMTRQSAEIGTHTTVNWSPCSLRTHITFDGVSVIEKWQTRLSVSTRWRVHCTSKSTHYLFLLIIIHIIF